jgi:hypothetical protein
MASREIRRRQTYGLVSLRQQRIQNIFYENPTPTKLITCDQPVFNIHAVGALGQIPEEVELYYPVTPTLAIMLSKKSHNKTLTESEARELNSWVREMSHEQIYSASQEFL